MSNLRLRNSARADDELTIIAKQLQAKKLSALTAGDVKDLVNALRERGLAPRTVRIANGALRAALTTAVRQKKLTYIVATDAILPRQAKREIKFLTAEEGQRVLDAVEAAARDERVAGSRQPEARRMLDHSAIVQKEALLTG